MRYLNKRYVKILEHKGIAVCVLKEAVPPEDELGYRIDHETLKGEVFGHLQDALTAIDAYKKISSIKCNCLS